MLRGMEPRNKWVCLFTMFVGCSVTLTFHDSVLLNILATPVVEHESVQVLNLTVAQSWGSKIVFFLYNIVNL